MLNQKIIEKIKQNSISLEIYGVNELAWNKEDAKNIIRSILDDRIGILGGDVYEITKQRLVPLYDNWACEQNKNETEDEFYFRSKTKSLRYIENYPLQLEKKIIFSMVFTEFFL